MSAQATKRKREAPEESGLTSAVYSKSETAMGESLISGEESALVRSEAARIISQLEGEGVDITDAGYLLIQKMNVKKGVPSDEFMDGTRLQEVVELPNPKEDREHFARKLSEFAQAQQELPPEERSHIHVEVLEKEGIAIITNTFFLPAPILKKKEEFAQLFRDIEKTGNAESLLCAIGCWSALKASVQKSLELSYRVEYYGRAGERRLAMLGEELVSIHREVAKETYSRLKLLSEGTSPDSAAITNSAMRTEELMKKEKRIYSKIEEIQLSALSNRLLGKWAMNRIEAGIKEGYYTQLEVAAYEGVKREIELLSQSMRSLSTAGIQKVLTKGMEGLNSKEKEAFEKLESLVAHLEFIAYKADMHELDERMHKESHEYMQSPRTPLSNYAKLSKMPMSQLAMPNIERVEEISFRAKKHTEMLKKLVGSLEDLTHAEKSKYKKEIDSLAQELETGVLSSLEAASAKADRVLGGIEALLGERVLEKRAADKDNPWNVRASSYVKIYSLRYSLEVIAASAAAGGAIGGFATRSPGGVWAGAKVGAKVGGLIVASAGAFLTGEAMYHYLAGEGNMEQAVEDMRIGSTYLAFGLLGAPMKALSIPVKLATGGGLVASNSLLIYEHLKAGRYWEVPEDVAYVALGSVAFIRTATGVFRAIRLAEPAESLAIANASGAAKIKIGTKLAERMVKVHKAGYSPVWVGVNAGFATLGNWGEISESIDKGNYNVALSQLGRGFVDMTRGMVTFEFALAGVAGGARGGVRFFSARISSANARAVAILQKTGLFERVSDMAYGAGFEASGTEASARLLQLTFAEGRVSARYVQEYLGLKSLSEAGKISEAINSDWKLARTLLSKGKKAGKAWERFSAKVERAAKSRKARFGKAALLVGAVYYLEKRSVEEQLNAKALEQVITPYEFEFISSAFASANARIKVSEVGQEDFYNAVGIAKEISDEVDAGAGSPSLQFGMDSQKRLWVLSACAYALLLNGQKATKARISSLASKVHDATQENGISLVYRPVAQREKGGSYSTHFGSVAMMASMLLRDGVQGFSDAYSYVSAAGEQPPEFLDYAITSMYAASIYDKGYEWGSEAASSVFDATRETPEHATLGWELLFALGALNSPTPSKREVEGAFAASRRQAALWGE
ncbi:hypothetical protein JW721_04515 [Candidatus Micrarchaeota archaeon]|nr:hypothetical protein [Candidatus Micrarchaeota archaeon]